MLVMHAFFLVISDSVLIFVLMLRRTSPRSGLVIENWNHVKYPSRSVVWKLY